MSRPKGRPKGSITRRAPPAFVSEQEQLVYLAALGREVRRAREECGVSVASISAMLGIHSTAFHRLEAGSKPRRGSSRTLGPSLRTIIRIARALGVQPSELLP